MAVIAFVTRIFGDPLSQETVGLSDSGNGSAYVARRVSGLVLGTYRSAGDAQNAVRFQLNSGRLVRWTREDLVGDIESYKGEVP